MPLSPIARLLIVDDEAALMKALCDTLETEGYSTSGFTSPSAALAALRDQSFDLVLSDLMMPEMDGIAFLRAALEIDPGLIGIVMTGHGTIDTAVQAMQAGALDYILKPFRLSVALPVLGRALAVRRLRAENVELNDAVGIYKLSMAVAFTCDFGTVLEKIADAALMQSRVRSVSILVPADDGDELRVAIVRGEKAECTEGTLISFSHELAGWVQRSRDAFARAGELPEITPAPVAPLPEYPHSISIPLLAGGTFVGILILTSEYPRKLTAPGQSKGLAILASAAAAAIQQGLLIERLRRAEQRYRRLTENAVDIVFRYELYPQPGFTYVNPAAQSITGYSPGEYYADPDLGLRMAYPDDRPLMERMLRGTSPGESAVTLRCVHREGNLIWMEPRTMLVRDEYGRLVAVEGIARDVTERKLAEESIRRSLQEKDVMLQEIHHRVKNNLQVVSSLLSLQGGQLHDPAARAMFTDTENRIQSMALIHQQLDDSKNFAEIDFGAYLRSIANHLLASYATAAASFTVSLDATCRILSLAEAVPCGLIVNELISNSLKHSFSGRSTGEIRVGFHAANGICTLIVDDDGSPFCGNQFGASPPIGLRLVQALARQLGGEFQSGNGQEFRITFPDRDRRM